MYNGLLKPLIKSQLEMSLLGFYQRKRDAVYDRKDISYEDYKRMTKALDDWYEEAKKHIDEVIDKMVVSDETQSKYFRDQSELLEALLKIVPLKD